ncbi:GH11674 [Drosophila grimshawi]|uniref:GH11674 n=1 Tax=Drosophila grimshawi TaxID=7222 RepID=B4JCP6_DROGR|nr:GH11674 [Drosophila grimshawi]
MMGTMSLRQPENWLYEIWQKGYDSPCYVMVPNAKDLVKSHLMIAVREEVEVLKERISELMDKISNLELENNILKSNIAPETLQQLQMQLQITGSQQPAAVAAPPATPAIQAAPASTVAVTSPASSASAPTENGTDNNGTGVDATVTATAAASAIEAAAQPAAAVAAVSTNGPMS